MRGWRCRGFQRRGHLGDRKLEHHGLGFAVGKLDVCGSELLSCTLRSYAVGARIARDGHIELHGFERTVVERDRHAIERALHVHRKLGQPAQGLVHARARFAA